ncbi:MAG: LytR/AlgR family response regulator transcription factor [Muribaculaceae bacterium]
MKCIAIDDELIALKIIEKYCERFGDIELEIYTSPAAGMCRIMEWQPDAVFLDVEMKSVLGTDLAKKLPANIAIVFTTAYAQYAIDGFDVDAVDFLHKPFFFDRFSKAITKIRKRIAVNDLIKKSQSDERQITINCDYKKIRISIDTILYIESFDNYVKFHTSDGKTYITKQPLYTVEKMLPSDEFLRIHRSYIISKAHISGYNKTEVYLNHLDKPLPIGKSYAESIKLITPAS